MNSSPLGHSGSHASAPRHVGAPMAAPPEPSSSSHATEESPVRLVSSFGEHRHGANKRRRSFSSDDDTLDKAGADSQDELTKRRRGSVYERGLLNDVGAGPSTAKDALKSHDLGRLLASFDKQALLSLLLDLAKQDGMADRIYTLLPTPSVDHAVSALQAYEARIRTALPTSTSVTVRDQYVWSRVRTVLSELVSELACLVPLFSILPRRDDAEPPHPSTTFAFLQGATSCMLRIARMLPPDPVSFKHVRASSLLKTYQQSLSSAPDVRDLLAHTIFPMLLREWQAWLDAIDVAVNEHARMFGQEAILAWERGMASLGSSTSPSHGSTEQAMRAVMDDAAAHMQSSIGWLAASAHRASWLYTPSSSSLPAYGASNMSAMDMGDE